MTALVEGGEVIASLGDRILGPHRCSRTMSRSDRQRRCGPEVDELIDEEKVERDREGGVSTG